MKNKMKEGKEGRGGGEGGGVNLIIVIEKIELVKKDSFFHFIDGHVNSIVEITTPNHPTLFYC